MAQYKLNNILIPEELPLIALKNTVLFPKVVIPLIVQRPKSVEALDAAMAREKLVFFVTQKNIEDNVHPNDMFKIGTIGRVVAVFKLPDGSSKIDVEGLTRAKLTEIVAEEPFFRVKCEPTPSAEFSGDNLAEKALSRLVIDQFRQIAELKAFSHISPEITYMMSQLKDVNQVISLITINLNLEILTKP